LGKKHLTCLPIKAKPESRPGSGLVHTERSESSKSSETCVFILVVVVAAAVVAVVTGGVSCGDTGNDDESLLMPEDETTDRVFPDERKRSATTQPFFIRNADPPVQLFVFAFAVGAATGVFAFAIAVATGVFVFAFAVGADTGVFVFAMATGTATFVFATATGVFVLVVARGGGGAIALVLPLVPLFLLVLLLLALADDDAVVADGGNALSVSFPFCFSVEDLTGFGLLERTVGAIVKCDADAMRFVATVKWKRKRLSREVRLIPANTDLDSLRLFEWLRWHKLHFEVRLGSVLCGSVKVLGLNCLSSSYASSL
jgi:hypothetical protein